MKFADKLGLYLESPVFDQFLPLLWVSLGAVICFIIMEWVVLKWKRRYRDLLAEHKSFENLVELENRFKEEKIDHCPLELKLKLN